MAVTTKANELHNGKANVKSICPSKTAYHAESAWFNTKGKMNCHLDQRERNHWHAVVDVVVPVVVAVVLVASSSMLPRRKNGLVHPHKRHTARTLAICRGASSMWARKPIIRNTRIETTSTRERVPYKKTSQTIYIRLRRG